MGKVTVQDIATKLTTQNGLSKKDAVNFTNKVFDLIREALERDKSVKVKGLGTFKIIDVDSRESVNVNTGERVLIEGHNKITFTPDVLMKELVNKPFSQFETIVLNDGVDFKDPSEQEQTGEATENEAESMPLVDFVSEASGDGNSLEWVYGSYETPANMKPIDLGEKVESEPVGPEPVVEQEQPVGREPIVEHEPIVEPEPVVEQEPLVETPVVSEPSVQESLDTPDALMSSEEPEEPADQELVEEGESSVEDEAYSDAEEELSGDKSWMLWLLACLLALGLGYLLGNYLPFRNQTASEEKVVPQVEKTIPAKPAVQSQPVAKPVTDEQKEVDAEKPEVEEPEVKEIEPQQQPEPQKQPEVSVPAKTQNQPEPQKQPEVKAPAEVKLDKYEAMDARVRTGAYRIVGLDYKLKVKEGDNLQRIAKRTLGQDMECYIEVYNNLKPNSALKAGQEINIPKLVLKKKKAAQK